MSLTMCCSERRQAVAVVSAHFVATVPELGSLGDLNIYGTS